ncbi:MAG: MGMT family protein [Muribaculaceae bacterium]|nr:MGMT family protein [Muribaculaceae bacterium]
MIANIFFSPQRLPKSTREVLSVLHDERASRRIGLSDFTRRVLLATLEIPEGETISYGDLAKKIGAPGAARAIGNALHSNPLIITVPCHRVVPADYPRQVGGYRYGSPLKRRLLLLEKDISMS